MLQFPGGGGFVVVTDLQFANAADDGTPGETADNSALAGERIKIDMMFGRPAVLGGGGEDGAFVSDVRVLERELADAERGKGVDVAADVGGGVDVAARHDAGGPNGEGVCGVEERAERWGGVSHQLTVAGIVIVVP